MIFISLLKTQTFDSRCYICQVWKKDLEKVFQTSAFKFIGKGEIWQNKQQHIPKSVQKIPFDDRPGNSITQSSQCWGYTQTFYNLLQKKSQPIGMSSLKISSKSLNSSKTLALSFFQSLHTGISEQLKQKQQLLLLKENHLEIQYLNF